MILTRFRLQNFKIYDDTDWIEVSKPTVFVGKNEAGKTALFRGLSKLNPSDGAKYNRLKDFPRNRLTSEYEKQDWPGASAVFTLTTEEIKDLKQICPNFKSKEIKVTRYYSGKLEIEINHTIKSFTNNNIVQILEKWSREIGELIAPDDKGPQLEVIKNAILPVIDQIKTQIESEGVDEEVDYLKLNTVTQTIDTHINEEWQSKLFSKILKKEKELKDCIEIKRQIERINEYVENNLPVFVYFDEYGIIDTAVNIPRFIEDLKQKTDDLKIRSQKCLFEHVGLDVETLYKLDPANPQNAKKQLQALSDERQILMNSASQEMTTRFQNWWEQRKHQFEYKIDGSYFRIWVSDNIDPSEIELDQRSRGLQYFFSFYLVFIQEAEKRHKNAILLLDEPGLFIHASAQQKIVEFIENLSTDNQLLYTTHSPFMIDGDRLENVRIIYEDKRSKKSRISQDTWPSDQEALFPLQAALGYSIAQTLFYSKRQLVVEGLCDYQLLKAMSQLLAQTGKTSLKDDIVIVPAGGTRNILPLSSMLVGHNVKIAILLDGDEAGKRKGNELEKKLRVNTIYVTDYLETETGEIEDIFGEETYLDALKEAYPDIEIKYTEQELEEKCISKRNKTVFKKLGQDFDKWRPARILSDYILSGDDRITKDTRERFEKMFESINRILK